MRKSNRKNIRNSWLKTMDSTQAALSAEQSSRSRVDNERELTSLSPRCDAAPLKRWNRWSLCMIRGCKHERFLGRGSRSRAVMHWEAGRCCHDRMTVALSCYRAS